MDTTSFIFTIIIIAICGLTISMNLQRKASNESSLSEIVESLRLAQQKFQKHDKVLEFRPNSHHKYLLTPSSKSKFNLGELLMRLDNIWFALSMIVIFSGVAIIFMVPLWLAFTDGYGSLLSPLFAAIIVIVIDIWLFFHRPCIFFYQYGFVRRGLLVSSQYLYRDITAVSYEKQSVGRNREAYYFIITISTGVFIRLGALQYGKTTEKIPFWLESLSINKIKH